MKKSVLAGVLLLIYSASYAQIAESTYRSTDNPYCWKNRKPHEAYWQQDVDYHIKARIDDQKDILEGTLRLTYYNNSPDTLTYVYFHLYQNAFIPGSYYHQISLDNNRHLHFGTYQQKGLGTVVEDIYVDGIKHEEMLDNTIMRINLYRPILSQDSAVFEMRFKTYFNIDGGWGRMRLYERWGFKHFNGAHFYPRISVYDSKFGWTADQHLVHEFYGNFGSYKVALDFPANYILEATGVLVNEEEVLPEELRRKIDIKNFKNKEFNAPPSVIIPYDSTERKIWKYHAINVHDFAFVASPTYRLGEVVHDGVRCIAIAHEPHAAKWQTAAQLTADIIEILNQKVGPYAYPKMVVADAFSGMEYPMLTMNHGHAPDYAYIFSHEIAHNWFYGIIGSNETYEAFIDEGFTQYLTIYTLEKLSEKYQIESPPDCRWRKKFERDVPLRDKHAYLRYLRHAIKTDGATLNTHSDMYDTHSPYGETYRQTYYKSAVMLFNLKYVLGEDLFNKALRSFFNQWQFCHPYAEDMRASFIHSSNVDLNWFFDQFLETKKVIDYAVKGVRKIQKPDLYAITFERKGDMQMPIDFTVVAKNDSLYKFHIPNTNFIKETEAVVLPKWYGWMHFNREYTAEVAIKGGIKDVIIDPSGILADVYAPDNALRKNITHGFNFLIEQTEDPLNYEISYRPDLWWNAHDGLKAGINVNGHYMKHYHLADISLWYNTTWLRSNDAYPAVPLSYSFNYNNPIGRYHKQARIYLQGLHTEGFHNYSIKATYNVRERDDYRLQNSFFYAQVKSIYRPDNARLHYLIHPQEWTSPEAIDGKDLNNSLSLGYKHFYNHNQYQGMLKLQTQTSFLFSPYDFSSLSLTYINNTQLSLLRFRSRIFGQWSTGRLMPVASMLYLAGANPETMLEDKFIRSVGIIPSQWGGYGPFVNNFHAGGGLNVRGYAGYLAPQESSDGKIFATYRGHSGIAINTELEFDAIFNVKPPRLKNYIGINTYFFADGGLISINELDDPLDLSHLRFSAGIGLALNIKKWWCLDKLKPLTLRLDFPLLLNRPPALSNDFIEYRWIFGFHRAF